MAVNTNREVYYSSKYENDNIELGVRQTRARQIVISPTKQNTETQQPVDEHYS